MTEETTQDIRIDHLEQDMAEVKGKVAEFGKHVAECTALKEKALEEQRQEREDRKDREDRYWKIAKVAGLVLLGLAAVDGHDEAWDIIRAILGI